MQNVYHLIFLLVWTSICAAFVAGLERLFESFGYRAQEFKAGRDHVPPLPPAS